MGALSEWRVYTAISANFEGIAWLVAKATHDHFAQCQQAPQAIFG
jgi:hypothetical protein